VGADPFVILSDLAEFTHLVTTAKLADGVPRGQALSDLEKAKAEEFAELNSLKRVLEMGRERLRRLQPLNLLAMVHLLRNTVAGR